MNRYPSPRELADEALQAKREMPMTPRERWEFLIQQGIIDENGRVLLCKLFNTETSTKTNGTPPAAAATQAEPAAPAAKEA